MLVTLYTIGEVYFHLLGTNGFRVKAKNEGFTATVLLSSEPQIWKFHVVVWQTTSKNCIKKRAARAARLFSSFNQSNHWFMAPLPLALPLPLPSSFLKRPNNIFLRRGGHANFVNTSGAQSHFLCVQEKVWLYLLRIILLMYCELWRHVFFYHLLRVWDIILILALSVMWWVVWPTTKCQQNFMR